MIAGLAAAGLGAGVAIGYVLVRRFRLVLWVGLILICVGLTLAALTGMLVPASAASAALLLLVPPPLGAGLLAGGMVCLLLRRRSGAS